MQNVEHWWNKIQQLNYGTDLSAVVQKNKVIREVVLIMTNSQEEIIFDR